VRELVEAPGAAVDPLELHGPLWVPWQDGWVGLAQPSHWAALLAGRSPEPKWNFEGKQRSVHNNYLTLPVILLMISNHYPLLFATRYNWIIVAIVLLLGPLIRHFYNSRHAGKGSPQKKQRFLHRIREIKFPFPYVVKYRSDHDQAGEQKSHGQGWHFVQAPIRHDGD